MSCYSLLLRIIKAHMLLMLRCVSQTDLPSTIITWPSSKSHAQYPRRRTTD